MSPAAQPASAARQSSRTGVVFSVLAVLAVAAGAGYWSAQRSGRASAPDRTGPVKGSLHLETFVLNLADPEQRSYLRVGIDLGLSREIGRGETAPAAQVRDTILAVLAQCRVEDLLAAKGKTKLKEDILRALQERVPGLGVEEVYFTEFLIQR
jgi:flagellar basal body-associated protein FliL